MEERVNLRLSSEVYKPYARMAQLMTGAGHPVSVTTLIRWLVESQVEQAEIMVTYLQAVLRGDLDVGHELFSKMLDWNQSALDLARTVEVAEARRSRVGSAAV
jgi:hypothetical protein